MTLGTAGYGNDSWADGHSYADVPVLTPALFDPAAPKGQKWSKDGLQQKVEFKTNYTRSGSKNSIPSNYNINEKQ